MRISHLLALAALAPTTAALQNPRPSTQVDVAAAGTTVGQSVASDGDVSAVVWKDTGDEGIYLSLSDGRGLVWTPPILVTTDPAPKFLPSSDALKVHGGNVYVTWIDGRTDDPLTAPFTEDDVFLRVYDSTGTPLTGEVQVPKSTPAGVGDLENYEFDVTSEAGVTYVYVLSSTDLDTTTTRDLFLAVSSDGGATFPTTATLATGALADVDDFAFDAEGRTAHVAWQDNRIVASSNDLFYQRTDDAGATLLAADTILSTGAGIGDAEGELAVAASGTTVAVVWQEEDSPPGGPETLRGQFSTNGGVLFNGEVVIGGYAVGTDDVDAPTAAIGAAGEILVAWDDDRTGSDEVYFSRSTDGGVVFSPDVQLSAAGGGFPAIAAGDSGEVAVVWSGGGFPEVGEVAYSNDGGATFEPTFTATDHPGADVDFVEAAFNPLYRNFVVSWLDDVAGSNNLYVGGFRPQTVAPVFGPGIFNYDLSLFEATDAFVIVFASLGNGPTSTGDGRLVDLSADAVFSFTLTNFTLFLATPVGGAGSTPPVPLGLPSGFSLQAAGVGLTATGALSTLTDAVTVTFP